MRSSILFTTLLSVFPATLVHSAATEQPSGQLFESAGTCARLDANINTNSPITSRLNRRAGVRWTTPLAPRVILYITNHGDVAQEQLERVVEASVQVIDRKANSVGRDTRTFHNVSVRTLNTGDLTLWWCPYPEASPRFTWGIAHEATVSLREFFRASGWSKVKVVVHRVYPREVKKVAATGMVLFCDVPPGPAEWSST